MTLSMSVTCNSFITNITYLLTIFSCDKKTHTTLNLYLYVRFVIVRECACIK